jgi:hypothetical protein
MWNVCYDTGPIKVLNKKFKEGLKRLLKVRYKTNRSRSKKGIALPESEQMLGD